MNNSYDMQKKYPWRISRFESDNFFGHHLIYGEDLSSTNQNGLRMDIRVEENGTLPCGPLFSQEVYPDIEEVLLSNFSHKYRRHSIIKERIDTTPSMLLFWHLTVFAQYLFEAKGKYTLFSNNCRKFCDLYLELMNSNSYTNNRVVAHELGKKYTLFWG